MSAKRLASLAAAVIASVAVVCIVRAATLPSRQADAEAAPPFSLSPEDLDAVVQRYSNALTYRTVSYTEPERFPAAEFERFRAFLVASYPRMHAALERELVGGHTLLYTWRGSDPALDPLLMMGHQDVVPADSPQEWTHPPFAGVVEDGVLWGRGALDDKNHVMLMSEAIERLIGEGFTPRRTVMLSFGHDEELGGWNGAAAVAALLEVRGVHPFLVIDEGGTVADGMLAFVERPIALVGVAERGAATLELSAKHDGAAHSSLPPKHTPIGRVAAAVAKLEANPFPSRMTEATGAMLDYIAPETGFGARLLLANRWLTDPLLLAIFDCSDLSRALVATSQAATMARGSSKANVIPSEAGITVNFRIIPGETRATTVERVRRVIEDDTIRVEHVRPGREPSPVSDLDGPAFALLQRGIRSHFPEAIVAPYQITGGTDARHFYRVSDAVFRFTPSISTPADLTLVHGVDERIAVDSLGPAIGFWMDLLRRADSAGAP